MTRVKPPVWFWVAGGLLVLWGVVGVWGFQMDVAATAADRATMDAYDQRLYTDRPGWFLPVYGIAVWTGLIGSGLLLARRALARPLYVVSLVAIVVMFGWMFVATDIVAVKGALVATGFPVVIALLAVGEIALTGTAIRRGWIG